MHAKFIVSCLGLLMLVGAGCQSTRSWQVTIPREPVPPVVTSEEADENTDRLDDLGGLIDMSENGFTLGARAIKGKQVQFRNIGKTEIWPASSPHPSHTDYAKFDAKRGVKPGESYYTVFPEAKTYRFHDHLNPIRRGELVVE
ncbi:MAG: hypothetical protein Q7N87_02295 [Candidatus Uhrbacteria bacterium]|nr:hypothetical protein [Candidatus Uhrbacteria bacterium]